MNENEILKPTLSDASPAVPRDAWGLEPLWDITELADYLGIPVATIYDWRTHGKGPTAYRFGKHLKFALSDVRDWVASQREQA